MSLRATAKKIDPSTPITPSCGDVTVTASTQKEQGSDIVRPCVETFHSPVPILPEMRVFHARDEISTTQTLELSDADQYAEGFRAGQAEAMAVNQKTIQTLEKTLAQLADGMVNLQIQIEGRVMDAFRRCASQLFPDMAQEAIKLQIHKIIESHIRCSLSQPIEVGFNPQNTEIHDFLLTMKSKSIVVEPDLSLRIDQVVLDWGNGGAILDADPIVQSCMEAIENLQSTGLTKEERNA